LKAGYRSQRLTSFLHPSADTQGAGYQIYQGLIALGSGSWWGLGIGRSQQKFHFVPEVESDSIFAIIGEELGFVITAILVILFASLFIRGVHIARHAPDRYGSLLAWGITLLITLQVLVNVGAIVGLLPLTGVPLPFMSLGGTNIVVLLAGLGILLNISTYTKEAHG
jgi:cell division protein FtsW